MNTILSRDRIQFIIKIKAIYLFILALLIVFSNLIPLGLPLDYSVKITLFSLLFSMSIGLFIASFSIEEYWPVTLLVFINKLVNIGFLFFNLSLKNIIFVFINDLIWLPVLWGALNLTFNFLTADDSSQFSFNELLKFVRVSQGKRLVELSNERPLLLIFIRHFGCTFCRETVHEVAKLEDDILNKGLTPVFVHMSDQEFGEEFFNNYYKKDVLHISDPNRSLYKALNIKRGSLMQLFGPRTWYRGVIAGLIKGHGIGALEGDGLQLGGFFILDKGQIVFSHHQKSASEQFDPNLIPNF